MRFYLVDNGSLRADSWRNLVRVASELAERTGEDVVAASLLHSSKIPLEQLNGERAWTLIPAMKRDLEAGHRQFGIIPFFFGPSLAITDYMPARLAVLREHHPDMEAWIAPTLFDIEGPAESTLVEILGDQVRAKIAEVALSCPHVVLVDHGSPVPVVTRVRDHLAAQLSTYLEGEVASVAAASMERREGPEYAFNEPLLERRLSEPPYNHGDVVISLLFLSPGRHAGEGGDISAICSDAEAAFPGLRTHRAELAGTHPGILDILERRVAALLNRA